MRLKYKVNFLSLSILVIVASAITGAGVLTIERLTYNLNRKLMSAEVSHVVSRLRMADKVLEESGVGHVESYVRKAQSDLLDTLREYRYGRTGHLIVVDMRGPRQLLPEVADGTTFDMSSLEEIKGCSKGVSEYSSAGVKRYFFHESFPRWQWTIILSVDTKEMFAERDVFLRNVVIILLAGLVFGCLAFLWFTSTIVGPIQQLSKAALSFGPCGWQEPLPEVHARDEVGALTRAFQEMSEGLLRAHNDLKEQTRQLQQTNVKLHREVTEHKKTAAQLKQLNRELESRVLQRTAQLEATNRELEAFSYSVSHDLRAPLRSIDGFSKALLDDYGSRLDGDGLQFLHRVRRASQRMSQLIDDLLNLSRITRGEMVRKTVDLSAMATTIVEGLRQTSPQRSVAVTVKDGVFAEGDPRLLQVVMENLLDNAWKFTARCNHAVIAFGVTPEGCGPDGEPLEKPVFFVRDNGAGFDPAYAEKLFGVFQRLHHAGEFPGTGIGLATVQRIIRRHSGRIWAEGRIDGGACFYFTL
ncbi:sensor histidine kinase, HAMP domain-containing [Syntrophotalea carbinolica DSM 2380]|uniref:histidine kinase n=1 Tax=Syntrophotalea carbinolica (strain DSM 2380 / NBRC 103641 / GraBd1) TaxID=338963 RepID=Q3A1F2_SYNC1|nr:ATP-binding protein [Syntrophotalea carbinolica]ABA89805.1 sensor histidine kinase, HAMP domain-containing [Syntrophotalea carbinolica DSM 2380]